jgi:predicted RNase H-like HicB family nuclease
LKPEAFYTFKNSGGSNAMELKIILEPSDEGGFTALVPSLPGCISEGDTREEALLNVREAIDLYGSGT